MARRLEERVPLLSDEELPEEDLGDVQVSFQQLTERGERAPPSTGEYAPRSTPGAAAAGSAAGQLGEAGRKRKHYSGNEMIVAVFVVQFDIRKGELSLLHTCMCVWVYVPFD